MTKRTETCNAPQQRRKKGTFHKETELVSLTSVVQFFGSYHEKKKKKKSSSQNLISKSIHKMKKDAAKF